MPVFGCPSSFARFSVTWRYPHIPPYSTILRMFAVWFRYMGFIISLYPILKFASSCFVFVPSQFESRTLPALMRIYYSPPKNSLILNLSSYRKSCLLTCLPVLHFSSDMLPPSFLPLLYDGVRHTHRQRRKSICMIAARNTNEVWCRDLG